VTVAVFTAGIVITAPDVAAAIMTVAGIDVSVVGSDANDVEVEADSVDNEVEDGGTEVEVEEVGSAGNNELEEGGEMEAEVSEEDEIEVGAEVELDMVEVGDSDEENVETALLLIMLESEAAPASSIATSKNIKNLKVIVQVRFMNP